MNKNSPSDIALADIHCHILPNVDDGPQELSLSLAMLEREYSDGVRTVIFTPHYRLRMFETSESDVLRAFEAVKSAASGKFHDLALFLGAEVHTHREIAESVEARPQLRMAGSDYVLVEFKEADEGTYIRKRLYRLRSHGYTPIIAHTERVESIRKDKDLLENLSELGILFQVNADSILGYDGFGAKRFCRELIERDYLSFIGSDAHDLKYRPPRMGECARWMRKHYGVEYTQRIMSENPQEIINNGGTHGE